jgi:hypothetical protein
MPLVSILCLLISISVAFQEEDFSLIEVNENPFSPSDIQRISIRSSNEYLSRKRIVSIREIEEEETFEEENLPSKSLIHILEDRIEYFHQVFCPFSV